MKYIHIVQFHLMSGGGVGSVLTDLCEAMSKKSSEVYIISLNQREDIDINEQKAWADKHGIHVLLMQKDKKDSLYSICRNLRNNIKCLSKDDECCLFMHLKIGVLAGILSSLGMHNIKRVEVYHSGYMGYKLQAFVSRPFINHYISVSKEAKQQLIGFHVKENKIDVVYNGVDVEHIREVAQLSLSENQDGLSFVSVGRLSFEKGFKTPIEAYASHRTASQMVDTTYTMIGTGVQREECEALAKGYVDFTGVIPREDVYKRIGQSDVMILPSLWEGNSILMLEVLSLGKPMIITNIPSFREVLEFKPLEDNETCRLEWFGCVFRKEDVGSCKKAMSVVYEHINELHENEDRIRELGDRFSTQEQANSYIRIAKEC